MRTASYEVFVVAGRQQRTATVGQLPEDGSEIASTPLAEVAGRTRPADAKLLELARVMAI